MVQSIYTHQKGDEEIILKFIKQFRKLSDTRLLILSSEIKKKGHTMDHQAHLYFISLYYEINSREIDSDLIIKNDVLGFKEGTSQSSMKDILIQKGVELSKKSGAIVIPVSKYLANKISSKGNNKHT
ncbi:MAG: hypothetical protein RLZ47_1693 [Bacteroidota bacterium]|jgi:hypothetical protein